MQSTLQLYNDGFGLHNRFGLGDYKVKILSFHY